MVAVGDGAVVAVDVSDQLGEVERKLPIGLDWSDVPGMRDRLAARTRVVAIELDHDQIVRGDVGFDGVAAIVL